MCSSSPSAGRSPRTRAAAVRACLPVVSAVLAAGLTAGLAACGAARQATLPQTPATTETGSTGSASAAPGPGVPTSTAEVEVDRSGTEPAVVTGVRFAAHDGYDRLVVDLKGGIPGYSVNWVDEFVQDGSGKPMGVRGGAYLQLTLFPANAHDEDGEPTWSGGPVYAAGLANLADVVRTGDFEGRVGIGLALDRRAAFQVTEHRSPNRLVLDVAH
ncbi:AMIN-like domain-containing (lipo)protein [Nonomuraea fuscirosea]|uniref:AMIN-like domain-containing (lipo)protein n=1 Tax=Nonomuraea fuscirosea TaxID=1291556 RepID=UPI003426F91A